MNKLIRDLAFEHGEHSKKAWYAIIMGLLSIVDGILLLAKSWIMEKELGAMDIELFWTLFGAFGITVGGSMVNKMKQFRTSTNEKVSDDTK